MRPTPDAARNPDQIAIMAYLSGFVLTTLVFLVSFWYRPPDVPTVVLCTLKSTTGMDCPTCGMTRAFCALAKGEWQRALQFHPLSPAVFALFGWWWLRSLLYLLGKGSWVSQVESRIPPLWAVLAVAAAMLISWIVKLWLQYSASMKGWILG
jgi:hypothetical protein